MSRPRIAMTLLVRDEVDIVWDMVGWHLANGVDHIVAMDNASSDGTTEILEDYAATGALTLIHQPSDTYLQGVWHTEMAKIARDRHDADWIIPSDADEFWMPPVGKNLREVLNAVEPSVDLVRCDRRNLVGSREDIEAMAWSDALVWRADPELALTADRKADFAPIDPPFFYHKLPSKVILRPACLKSIARGAHQAQFSKEAHESHSEKIVIYHAPVRNKAEFFASTARIAKAVERDPTASVETSWKSRRWNRMAPNEAYAEALPDADRLAKDARGSRVRLDTRLRDAVADVRAGQESKRALYGADSGSEAFRREPLAQSVQLLVLGENREDVASVTTHLQALGARRPPPPAGLDLQTRIAALHRARGTAPHDPITARATREEIRGVLESYGTGGHGAVISDSDLFANLDLWRQLREDGHLAPAVVALVPPGERSNYAVGSLPFLEAPAKRILGAPPRALHRTLAWLGLWLPLHLAGSGEQR